MKTLAIELPDALAEQLQGLVDAGWFASAGEAGRLALVEFLGRHRLDLQEHFQREDVRWALGQKDSTASTRRRSSADQQRLGTSPRFWGLIAERRRQPVISRAELERRLADR